MPEMEFCDRLSRSMRLVKIKTGDVADYLSIDPATVSRWLSGRTRPNKATMIVLADMTGVELEWLETGQAPGDSPTPVDLLPRLDSNQQPSGYRSKRLAHVNTTLTQNRRPVVGAAVALGRAA